MNFGLLFLVKIVISSEIITTTLLFVSIGRLCPLVQVIFLKLKPNMRCYDCIRLSTKQGAVNGRVILVLRSVEANPLL